MGTNLLNKLKELKNFMRFLRVVIILFSAGLYKSAFSNYFYIKLGFRFPVLWFFVLLYLLLFIFLSEPPCPRPTVRCAPVAPLVDNFAESASSVPNYPSPVN